MRIVERVARAIAAVRYSPGEIAAAEWRDCCADALHILKSLEGLACRDEEDSLRNVANDR